MIYYDARQPMNVVVIQWPYGSDARVQPLARRAAHSYTILIFGPVSSKRYSGFRLG